MPHLRLGRPPICTSDSAVHRFAAMPELISSYVALKPASQEDEPVSIWYLLLLTAVALASGIANGYNGTVLEGTIPRLQYEGYMREPLEVGLLEGALSLGGLLGSLVCVQLATSLSRRVLVVVGETSIVLGVLLFASITETYTWEQAIIGRTLTGAGVGVCGLAKPLIVSELAPPRKRGLLVALFAVGQSVGMNVFFLTDWLLPGPETRWAWRVLVALGATPAVVVICLAFVFQERNAYWDVPPRSKTAGADAGAPRMLMRMLTEEPPSVRRNFGLIIALMVGYNLSGTLIISNYASDILADTTRKLPIVIGAVQFCGLVSAATLTDRVGRRPLLLGSCVLTVVGLVSISLLLGPLHAAPSESSVALWGLLGLMVTVEYAVGAGLNPIRIVLSAELMPNAYRSLGMSLGNASGWLLALASLFLYPVIKQLSNGPAPQFGFFGCVVAALTALLVRYLPETNGIDLGAK